MISIVKHLVVSEDLFRDLARKPLFWGSFFLLSWILLWQNRAEFHWDFDYMVMHSTIVMNQPSLLLGRFGYVVPLHLVYKFWSLLGFGVMDFQYTLRFIGALFGAGAITFFVGSLVLLRWPPAVAIGAGLMFLTSRYALMVGNDINTNIAALFFITMGMFSCLKMVKAKSRPILLRWLWIAVVSFGWALSIRSQSYFYFVAILATLPVHHELRQTLTKKDWLKLIFIPGLTSAIGPMYYSLRAGEPSFLARFFITHEDMGVQVIEPFGLKVKALFSHFSEMPLDTWGIAFLIIGGIYCVAQNRKSFLFLVPFLLAHLVLLFVLNIELLSYRRYFGAFYLLYFACVAIGIQWALRRDWLTFILCIYFCTLLRPWSEDKIAPRDAEALVLKRYSLSEIFDCPKFCAYMLGDKWPLAQLNNLAHSDRQLHSITNGWDWTKTKLEDSRVRFPNHKFIVDYQSHKQTEKKDLLIALKKYEVKTPIAPGVWEIPSRNDLMEIGKEPTNFEDP